MTNSEDKARKNIKEFYYNKCYIKKIPDFKVSGILSGGLPDYLVIYKGKTIWYEIKDLEKSKKSFSFDKFTEQQCIEFVSMTRNKAEIYIYITHGRKSYCVRWTKIYHYMLIGERKSIPLELLIEWDMNKEEIK